MLTFTVAESFCDREWWHPSAWNKDVTLLLLTGPVVSCK